MRTRSVLAASAVGLALVVVPSALAQQAPYPPPTSVSGQVDPSRIKQGECAVFSGQGFEPGTAVAVADSGEDRGSVAAQSDGTFSIRLCYPADARRGQHRLTGSGEVADGEPQAVGLVGQLLGAFVGTASAAEGTATATLTVTGAAQSAQSANDVQPAAAGLPRTGTSAIATALAGTLLIAAGAVLLLLAERRSRARRRLRA